MVESKTGIKQISILNYSEEVYTWMSSALSATYQVTTFVDSHTDLIVASTNTINVIVKKHKNISLFVFETSDDYKTTYATARKQIGPNLLMGVLNWPVSPSYFLWKINEALSIESESDFPLSSIKDALTFKEYKIMKIIQDNGGFIKRDQLINLIWKGVHVGDKTVDVHIFNLRKKLAASRLGLRYENNGWKFVTLD